MKENRNTKCDPCERDFKHKVEELVREGQAPSHTDRVKKEHEVKSAFAGQSTGHDVDGREPHAASKRGPAHAAARTSPAKPHAMAGAAKTKK